MVLALNYRRPAHVPAKAVSISSEKPSVSDASLSSGESSHRAGIPPALSFDRITNGGTCPPCTTRDFMNYLIYIEHSAENLQFFLWLRGYIGRFDALPESEKKLSPPISTEKLEAEQGARPKSSKGLNRMSRDAAGIFKDTDFAGNRVSVQEKPVFSDDESMSEDATTLLSSRKSNYQQTAANAFEAADVTLQPFTIQPYREEIERVIATYVAEGAPRELNLAAKERKGLLCALATTTHPSAFQHVLRTVEWALRRQAHPNFIRWTICNGNRPRVLFARGLGTAGIVGGVLTAVLLTVSAAGRAWRVMAALPFLIGIATLFAAWKGMCVVLHGMHHRHLRPWELFVDADDGDAASCLETGSLESIASRNSHEDAPWVARYEKRNILRKILDREVWIQEPALRQVQDTIFVQALLVALLATAAIVGVFVALPGGGMFSS